MYPLYDIIFKEGGKNVMINILFDCPNIDDFYDDLKHLFNENTRVCVLALSYYDDYVYDLETWERVYGKDRGNCYYETVDSFAPFGVKAENIDFVNYFTDTKESATEKIKNADVLYFTGGLPDRMMDRIADLDLQEAIMQHDGIVMGYSAGAVIQLEEYHLYPDGDYADFGYYRGLPMLKDFYLEVHYRGLAIQDESVKKCLRERGKRVYDTHDHGGGLLIEKGKIKLIGRVDAHESI